MIRTISFGEFTRLAATVPLGAAFILGSGMSDLADRCEILARVPFSEVPGMSAASVEGHRGSLALGEWAGKRVLFFEGRLHFYEGHTWNSVVQPVLTAHALGTRTLILTNAAGGIREDLGPGSLLALRDHIEWTRPYCWRQAGPGALGPVRPSPYSARLIARLEQVSGECNLGLQQGVYAAVTGPAYETKAEIRALRVWGADAVGMSTAREAQTAFDLGMECAAVSCITNKAAGLSDSAINHEEVLVTARAQSQRLGRLLEGLLAG